MDVEPQAVTRAVPERLSQSMRDEYLSRGPIHISRRHPRFDGLDRRGLRVTNRRMESDGVW
jgi:hypothetical protein